MRPIQQISGDVLLLIYALQRQGETGDGIVSLDRRFTQFESSEFGQKILAASGGKVIDAYEALRYLEEKGFLYFKESNDNMTFHFINMRVTAFGVDIVEGIEKGDAERKAFQMIFNIKLADNINVESLIKNELGSLVKISAI